MKKILHLCFVLVVCCAAYGQKTTINVNQYFDSDTALMVLNSRGAISGLSVDMRITRTSPRFLVRLILEGNDQRQYLIAESYREIAEDGEIVMQDNADETANLDGVIPGKLKLYVKNAQVNLQSLKLTSGGSRTATTRNTDSLRLTKVQAKVDKINAYNNAHQRLWTAGVTPLSLMTLEERMRALGFDVSDDTGGFEYYAGGIFEVGDPDEYVQNPTRTNSFVDEFDWTDRHGKNWMTSIKGQGYSNYCAAFTGVACLEALVNLYYNQKIDLDLSEQETACCCHVVTGRNPYTKGLFPEWVADFFRDYGVCEEDSYPFYDDENRAECGSDTISPLLNVKISGSNSIYDFQNHTGFYEDSIKYHIINDGPLASGFYTTIDPTNPGHGRSHAMALVGYGTIHAGDTIREIIGKSSNDSCSYFTDYYVIPNNSPLIGRTYFKFKNSNNIRINDDLNGYMYLIFHYMADDGYSCFDNPIRYHYPFTITNCQTNQPLYTNSDVVCEDADGDGYYFWGLGPKPSNCPSGVPDTPDGDDSDPTVGAMDAYGNLTTLTNEIVISSLVNYNTVKNFRHNIRITNGGHLRITNTTSLRNAAQIIVENGGILTIDGGTLNNARITFNTGSTLNIQNNGTIKKAAGQDLVVPIGTVVNAPYGNIL